MTTTRTREGEHEGEHGGAHGPGTVTLTVWRVPPRQVPAAVTRMALDRRHLRRAAGLRFAKLLGTGSGRTFTLRDADPLQWALLACWEDEAAADAFAAQAPTHRRWAAMAAERLELRMAPVSSRGRWAGREPFGAPRPRRTTGPVAALTRARLRPTRAPGFWRAVPPVSADLAGVPGLRLSLGIGEAPVGLQGTFSVWESAEALVDFAHRRAAHADVVRRTGPERWYAEELFARLTLTGASGRLGPVTAGQLLAPAPGDAGNDGTRAAGTGGDA